jgi:glutamate dehydrogenase/leucine dehydrogenase
MLDKLKQFEEKVPELVLEWNDTETEARGWLVINTLMGGAAGGGTRMKKGIDVQEVRLLAKTMEIKFTVSGPAIGGAKSGIDFDPSDPRKEGVLKRWYRAILPMLKTCYGTGGDLNVNYVKEVVPFTSELGILHPQEGILVGHLQGLNKEQKAFHLTEGASKIVRDEDFTPDLNDSYTVADLISGYSVAESVIQYYRIFGEGHQGKQAIIQGWGNVGSSAGYYLTQAGVKVIGIFDKFGGVINESGFDISDIRRFLIERETTKFSGFTYIPFYEMNDSFWKLPADIFVPAAASGLITENQVQSLIQSGIELFACGANVPFADDENFFGPIAKYADDNLSVIPDFVANCGMARVFAYLMQDNADISEKAIFNDVSATVKNALLQACERDCKPTKITQNVYEHALNLLI